MYAINNATLFSVGTSGALAVEAASLDGDALMLAAPRPNPVLRSTLIHFALPRAGKVRLDILDVGGRRVVTLLEGERAAGDHFARWDGRDGRGDRSVQGVYFLRLTDGRRESTRRLVLIQ